MHSLHHNSPTHNRADAAVCGGPDAPLVGGSNGRLRVRRPSSPWKGAKATKDQIGASAFLQHCEIALLGRTDPHGARAIEMNLAGESKKAERVLACGGRPGWIAVFDCHVRGCPRCSRQVAAWHAGKAVSAMRNRMRHRTWMRLSNTCMGDDTQSAKTLIDATGRALARLRRLKSFKPVLGGVAGRELQRTHTGDGWNFHIHLVADVDLPLLDVAATTDDWSRLTGGRGSVWIDPKEVENIGEAARYLAKEESWSPPPGKVHPDVLQRTLQALAGRRLYTSWGTGKDPSEPEAGTAGDDAPACGDTLTPAAARLEAPDVVPEARHDDVVEAGVAIDRQVAQGPDQVQRQAGGDDLVLAELRRAPSPPASGLRSAHPDSVEDAGPL